MQFGTTFREPKDRFEIDIAFTGGTGKFRDAGGDAHISEMQQGNNEGVEVWEVRLLHLRDQ